MSRKKVEIIINNKLINNNCILLIYPHLGPLKRTVNDFIRMLWEQSVPLVVMVTKVIEDTKVTLLYYNVNQF